MPSPKLRKLEIAANEAFDTYREMCVIYAFILASYTMRSNYLAAHEYAGILKAVSRACIYGISMTEASLV